MKEKRRWYERGAPSPDEEPALTQRDLSILFNLYTNRFMTTRQLQTLYGERIFRRLKRLFEHGYIDRPKAQRIWRMCEGGGSNPGIYAIANRGVQTLVAFGLIEEDRRDFSERNRELATFSLMIPHELAVSDIHILFRRACDARPGLRLADTREIIRGRDARALSVPGRDKLLYPDLIPIVARESEPIARANLFFAEINLSTEPNERRSSEELQSLGRKYWTSPLRVEG